MNTLLRIKGYVTSAEILEPFATYPDDLARHELFLFPESYDIYAQLERQIEELKMSHQMHQPRYSDLSFSYEDKPGLKDRVFARDCIKFESLHCPQLEGELSSLTYDDEFRGKYVQVVGHLQIQELGNCFLSFHIVEPAVHPADGFDN